MNHTPGPWEAVLENDPRGQCVPYYRGLVALVELSPDRRLSVVSDGRNVRADEWEANARLIAAAPELLDACRLALLELTSFSDFEEEQEARDALRAAIAKAEAV